MLQDFIKKFHRKFPKILSEIPSKHLPEILSEVPPAMPYRVPPEIFLVVYPIISFGVVQWKIFESSFHSFCVIFWSPCGIISEVCQRISSEDLLAIASEVTSAVPLDIPLIVPPVIPSSRVPLKVFPEFQSKFLPEFLLMTFFLSFSGHSFQSSFRSFFGISFKDLLKFLSEAPTGSALIVLFKILCEDLSEILTNDPYNIIFRVFHEINSLRAPPERLSWLQLEIPRWCPSKVISKAPAQISPKDHPENTSESPSGVF